VSDRARRHHTAESLTKSGDLDQPSRLRPSIADKSQPAANAGRLDEESARAVEIFKRQTLGMVDAFAGSVALEHFFP
jgi:hypothetical protein